MYKFRILSSALTDNLKPNYWLVLLYCLLTVFSFLAFWNNAEESIFLFGFIDLYDVTLSSVKEESFRILFYDLYSTFWVTLLLTYIPNKVIFPLSHSFSVNQSLWMRFLPNTKVTDVALSRVYMLFYSLSIMVGASAIWIVLYSILKGVDILELLIPVLGLVGHVCMAAGLCFLVGSNKKSSVSFRKSVVYILLLLPVLLYLIGDSTAIKLGGIFPYASPFSAKHNGNVVLKPFLTTLIIGILLISYYLGRNFYLNKN